MTCDLTSFFNSVSVISGRWADHDERLYAMGPHLRLIRFRLERGSNPGPLDQQASAQPSVIPELPPDLDD